MKSSASSSSISRRSFLFSAGVAAAVPVLTEPHFALAAFQAGKAAPKPMSQQQAMKQAFLNMPKDAVLINANENPLGPCEGARSAIASVAAKGGRYDILEMMKLVEVFAAQNGVPEDNVAVYAGSSEPLHFSVLSYTGPTRSFVAADPTYEAGGRAAEIAKAKTIRVPLDKTYAHDVKAMAAASAGAGVIYICNPNNPTGTITSREDILWLLDNKPKDTMVLVDEAYIHLSDAKSVVDQTASRKDIIVLRTFSKIYGMAGIRCGLAVAHPDILGKLELCGQNAMPITSSIAARVSLEDPSLIPTRKAYIAGARNTTLQFLADNHYKVIPGSQSNCFMIDTGRDGRQVMAAMAQKHVIIGRTWSVWPTVVRISVGTNEDMARFRAAFKEVMDSSPTAAELESFRRNPVAPHFS